MPKYWQTPVRKTKEDVERELQEKCRSVLKKEKAKRSRIDGSSSLAGLAPVLQTKIGRNLDKHVIAHLGEVADNTYRSALVKILKHEPRWRREINAWEPIGKSAYRQFQSLVDHLFCDYKIPTFLYSAWFDSREKPSTTSWLIALGQGASVKSLPDLPKVTKRVHHLFTKAPSHLTVPEAFRWAQVKSCGGDQALFQACRRYGFQDDREENFLFSLIQFFAANPLFERSHFQPVVDYSFNELRRNHAFSLKGRTPLSLLRLVETWHRELRLLRGFDETGVKKDDKWESCGFPLFDQEYGEFPGKNYERWLVVEICSVKDMRDEGRVLKHCVASYAYKCKKGNTAIFSLRRTTCPINPAARVMTIEVNIQARTVVQIRGLQNRLPTEKEKKIIRAWASQARLSVRS